MSEMLVTYDPEARATYVTFRDEVRVARTISVSDLVMVDVDDHNEPIGVEFAVAPIQISDDMLARLADRYPVPFKELAHDRTWLLTQA